jgi:hypothetical protein
MAQLVANDDKQFMEIFKLYPIGHIADPPLKPNILVPYAPTSKSHPDNTFFSIMQACSIAALGAGSSVITFNITKSCIVP